MQATLKQQIYFFKQEITVKNTIIENLLSELHWRHGNKNREEDEITSLSTSNSRISHVHPNIKFIINGSNTSFETEFKNANIKTAKSTEINNTKKNDLQ